MRMSHMQIDPRIKIVAGIIMAAISFFVAVSNYLDGDVRSGVILTIIGVFFSTVLVHTVTRSRTQDSS